MNYKILAVTVGLTVGFGLILFGLQTGNLLLTAAGGIVSFISGLVFAPDTPEVAEVAETPDEDPREDKP